MLWGIGALQQPFDIEPSPKHWDLNPCRQYQESLSGLLFNYFPGLMLLDFRFLNGKWCLYHGSAGSSAQQSALRGFLPATRCCHLMLPPDAATWCCSMIRTHVRRVAPNYDTLPTELQLRGWCRSNLINQIGYKLMIRTHLMQQKPIFKESSKRLRGWKHLKIKAK